MDDRILLKKQRLKVLNQRLAMKQVDERSSLDKLMDSVHKIRFEIDFMVLKKQCTTAPQSPNRHRYRHVIDANPCLQKIDRGSPVSVGLTHDHRFFPSSPVKNKVPTESFSPKAKSSSKEKHCPYSPIGMTR